MSLTTKPPPVDCWDTDWCSAWWEKKWAAEVHSNYYNFLPKLGAVHTPSESQNIVWSITTGSPYTCKLYTAFCRSLLSHWSNGNIKFYTHLSWNRCLSNERWILVHDRMNQYERRGAWAFMYLKDLIALILDSVIFYWATLAFLLPALVLFSHAVIYPHSQFHFLYSISDPPIASSISTSSGSDVFPIRPLPSPCHHQPGWGILSLFYSSVGDFLLQNLSLIQLESSYSILNPCFPDPDLTCEASTLNAFKTKLKQILLFGLWLLTQHVFTDN